MPNRWQTIIGNNGNLVYWWIYGLLRRKRGCGSPWDQTHGGTTEEGNCSYLLPLSHRETDQPTRGSRGIACGNHETAMRSRFLQRVWYVRTLVKMAWYLPPDWWKYISTGLWLANKNKLSAKTTGAITNTSWHITFTLERSTLQKLIFCNSQYASNE